MTPAPAQPSSLVTLEIVDGIATVTVNRPEALNSLTPAALHQLHQTFERTAADASVQGIVIAGAGKAFIVGADIAFFLRNVEAGDIPRIVKFTEAAHALADAIDGCAKPVVARVHGAAFGAGTEIALACDYVVATPQALFALPETGLGIYPGMGGTQRAPRKLGVGLAKWMIFTGKTISAADAWRVGLVDEVVPAEQLDAVTRALASGQHVCQDRPAKSPDHVSLEGFFAAHRAADLRTGVADSGGIPVLERAKRLVGSKPALALELAERIIDDGIGRPLAEGLRLEFDYLFDVFSSADAARGLRSRVTNRSS